MRKPLTLFLLVCLLGCTKSQMDESSMSGTATNSQLVTPRDFYSVSRTYGDVKSDSLLFPIEIMQQIDAFRVKGKEIKAQPYGGGDCWGRIRRYVLNNDTLTIDKHNCGEYGFGNQLFLKTGDSLKYVANYKIELLQNEKESVFNDLLEIVEFRRDEVVLRTSVETIKDWNNINLDRPPGKSDRFTGQNSVDDYMQQLEAYRKLKTYELAEEPENDFQALVSNLRVLKPGYTYDMVKQDAEDCYVPDKNSDSLFYNPAFPILGQMNNRTIYSLIHFEPGDDLYPVIRTFDNDGNLIDSETIVFGNCAGWDCEFDECEEKFKIINEFTIEDVITLVTTPCDSLGNKNPKLTKKEVWKKTISIDGNGKLTSIEKGN